MLALASVCAAIDDIHFGGQISPTLPPRRFCAHPEVGTGYFPRAPPAPRFGGYPALCRYDDSLSTICSASACADWAEEFFLTWGMAFLQPKIMDRPVMTDVRLGCSGLQ